MNNKIEFRDLSKKITKNEHFSLIVTFFIVFAFMSICNGAKFFSVRNISAMAYQLPMIGLLAIGIMISELTGGINLSLVSYANFCSIMIYVILNAMTGGTMAEAGIGQVLISLIAVFFICMLVGFLNGFLVAKLNIPAMLVTLGTMTFLQGLSLLLTKGYTISGYPKSIIFLGNGNIFGIPMSLVIFLIAVIFSHIILDKTIYGKQLYLTGANKVAAKYSNINVDRVIIVEYMFSSLFAFFASLVMIGQMNSAKANYYESYVLIAVLASFLGGVKPAGGFGKLMGTVIASVILQIISTGLNLMRMDPFMVTATWGAIIIIVLFGRELMAKTKNLINAKRNSKEDIK